MTEKRSALLDDLTRAASPPPPRDFAPGVIYAGGKPSTITTGPLAELATPDEWQEAVAAMGVPLPPGYTLELVEARYDPVAWTRQAQGQDAITRPAWRYKFRVVMTSASSRADEDLAVLEKAARRAAAARVPKTMTTGTTMVINLGDFQVGKVDALGGTPELLERSEVALAQVLKQVRRVKPEELVLVDGGDSTEGFESSPNAARTNDLQQTEQIRVWRRIFWRWIDALAVLGIPMRTVSVPSNHCRVRKGKDAQGPPDDDWGLEVLSQVADLAAMVPERYSHIEFIVPRKYEEHVTLTLAGGKIQSFAHGHQAKDNPDRLPGWVKRHGRGEIGVSDIVTVFHFHHLRVVSFGEFQTLFISPTMDGGSSWFTPGSGERSRPGVLTYVVDEDGWRDLFVAWA